MNGIYGFLSCLSAVLIHDAICSSDLIHTKKFEDLGQPLFLTEYIRNGGIEEARKAAKVTNDDFEKVISYSGFLRVNETYNKNLFIWFFPSQSDYQNDPVVLWLQGGPGGSSLFGLLTENGPFTLHKNLTITKNNNSWTNSHSVLYIDNPAGTGYSFTKEGGLNTEETQIGLELFEAVSQFLQLFPELRKNEFFVTGESYAGKYVPVLSYTIMMKNVVSPEELKINLKGLAIGNGITDPGNQLNLGEYAFQHGLIDWNVKKIMDAHKENIVKFLEQKRFSDATNENLLLVGTFKNASGFTNVYNYLYPLSQDDEALVGEFVQRNDIRAAIHVGNLTYHNGDDVSDALHYDIMKSVVDLLTPLLDRYRVLLYNGQLDVRLPYPCMVDYIRKMNFSAAKEYEHAKRTIWYVNGDIAGYAKTAGNLTELLVRNAGHLVPTDQPIWALEMINRFTRNKPFD